MRALLCTLALIVAACAPVEGTGPGSANQPHIPPPGFPVSQSPEGTVCGGMVAEQQNPCGAGEYCHRNIADQCGAADAPGVCRPIPEVCTQQYDPVCGCDGKTYGNECTANGQGVSAAYKGECTS